MQTMNQQTKSYRSEILKLTLKFLKNILLYGNIELISRKKKTKCISPKVPYNFVVSILCTSIINFQ